jgi:hypothetical protein
LVEREEYWQTERSWFKMRPRNFAPVSKQLTLKPDEMRTDAQLNLTASSNKTNALRAGQERCSARERTKFQNDLTPELARQQGLARQCNSEPSETMKLIRFGPPGKENPGILLEDGTRFDVYGFVPTMTNIFRK